MTYPNDPHLRRYLMQGGLPHLAVYASFEFPADQFEERLSQVRAQHPYLDPDEANARAAYRMLTAQAKRELTAQAQGDPKIAQVKKRLGIRFWIIVAAAIVIGGLAAGLLCAVAHAEPTPEQEQQFLRVAARALRGVYLLPMPAPALPGPQQPNGIILQLRNGGSTLATRPAGLVVFDCGTNMSCSFSGSTFTLTSSATGSTAWSAITAGTNAGQALLVGNGSSFAPTGSGTITSTAFTPAGTLDNCVKWGSGGALADFGAACGGGGAPAFTSITTGANTTATMTVGTGGTLTFSGTGVLNADRINGVEFTNAESLGKIPIGQGDGTAVWADPLVQGLTAHDAAGATTNPVAIGGYASAAAPTDVSADTDITRAWFLRNGSQVMNLASGGALVTLGQKAMSASLPVVLASDQSALAVTGTFFQATQPISAASLPLPTGASTLAEQQTQTTALQIIDNLPVAQGSTTSGQSGALTQGAVTTAAPTYTTGQTSPLSLTTAGELRVAGSFSAGVVQVKDASDVSTNVGYFTGNLNVPTQDACGDSPGTTPVAWLCVVGGFDGTNVQRISTNTSGHVNVAFPNALPAGTNNIGDVDILTLPNEGQQTMANSISVVPASDFSPADTVGSGTTFDSTNDRASVNVAGQQSASVFFATGASPVMTVVPECSYDGGTTWEAGLGFLDNAGAWAANVTNPSAISRTIACKPAASHASARVSAFTSGSTTATARATLHMGGISSVAIRSSTGSIIDSFGGGTQYAEDTAHVSGDTMTFAGVVQQAADTALSTDGDRSLLQVDANGYLKVNIKAGAGSGGTAQADRSTFTDGATSMTPIGGVFNETNTDPTEDQAAAVRITVDRALHVNLRTGGAGSTEIASGGGTEAAALRVTIANDSTGLVSVDDNGGSLTVDGTVAISGTVTVDSELPAAAALADNTANPTVPGVGGFLMAFDGTNWDRVQTGAATGGALKVDGSAVTQPISAASLPLPTGASTLAEQQTQTTALQLIDNLPVAQGSTTSGQSGVLVQGAVTTAAPTYTTAQTSPLSLGTDGSLRVNCTVGCAGGTQYAEDTAHVTGDTLTLAGVVQQTADTALAADGDRSLLQVDASGFLKVNIKAGAGSGGTAMTDDAAFTPGTTSFTPVGGTYRTTRDSLDDNDAGAVALTQTRAMIVSPEAADGTSLIADRASSSTTLDSANDRVSVALFGQQSASVRFETGTSPTFTVTAQCSYDNGTTYRTAHFVGQDYAWTTTAVNPSAIERSIVCAPGATHAGAEVTSFTSGSTTAIARAALYAPTLVSNVLRNTAGAETGVSATPLRIDPTGTTTQPISISQTTTNNDVDAISVVPGTGATNLGKAEDAAAGAGDTVVPVVGQRDDYPPVTTTSATGDYEVPHLDNSGATYTRQGGTGTGTAGPWAGYVNCDNTAIYSAATNGNTELVALTANETIVVCGFQISQSTSTTVSVRFVYGTGTACATGETSMTPTYPIQAAASTGPIGMVVMTPGFLGMKTAVSNALCIETNAAVSVQAMVWYSKFDETP